jgi:hypothetical protein
VKTPRFQLQKRKALTNTSDEVGIYPVYNVFRATALNLAGKDRGYPDFRPSQAAPSDLNFDDEWILDTPFQGTDTLNGVFDNTWVEGRAPIGRFTAYVCDGTYNDVTIEIPEHTRERGIVITVLTPNGNAILDRVYVPAGGWLTVPANTDPSPQERRDMRLRILCMNYMEEPAEGTDIRRAALRVEMDYFVPDHRGVFNTPSA